MKNLRRVVCLLLCLAMILSFSIGTFAASYSPWFQTTYEEMQYLDLIPSEFESMNLKQDITRAEMCRLAVYAFELATGNEIEPESYDYFSDTDEYDIMKAYEYGIVGGFPDGTFRPDDYLTRQQFFKIIENFCRSAAFRPTSNVSLSDRFIDANAVDSWAREAAEICVSYGYVEGSATAAGQALLPASYTSRQEAMAMFTRCYKVLQWYYHDVVQSAGVVVDESTLDVTVEDLDEVMYVNADKLNVRDSWTTDSAIVGRLSYGDTVLVTGQTSNGWYRIEYDDHTAYVSGRYLSEDLSNDADDDSFDDTQWQPAVGGSGLAEEIANFALSFVGYRYVYGGASPSTGFDCSGLMYYCLREYGYSMNRVADDQMDQGDAVSRGNLQVGDLVFFGYGDYADHVGMYIGNGNFVHASTPSTGVRINSLDETYYADRYIGARRIID